MEFYQDRMIVNNGTAEYFRYKEYNEREKKIIGYARTLSKDIKTGITVPEGNYNGLGLVSIHRQTRNDRVVIDSLMVCIPTDGCDIPKEAEQLKGKLLELEVQEFLTER